MWVIRRAWLDNGVELVLVDAATAVPGAAVGYTVGWLTDGGFLLGSVHESYSEAGEAFDRVRERFAQRRRRELRPLTRAEEQLLAALVDRFKGEAEARQRIEAEARAERFRLGVPTDDDLDADAALVRWRRAPAAPRPRTD